MFSRLKTFTTVAAIAAIAALGAVVANSGAATGVPVQNNRAAPEFTGIDQWLNSQPLTLQQLRGKVVLVDFWTYTCINCVHTLPHVEKLYEKYKDQGLVVVGVHTPEYAFERETKKVRAAIAEYGLKYPVAQDNSYATWNAYGNQYWPAAYLIDKQGHVVYSHFGEGDYDEIDAAVRAQLARPAQAGQPTQAAQAAQAGKAS
ncbi:thioredoxin family protein [Paraburkholderia sabiae]|uniref:Thioredoxin family protein n=1 Tax=Paraburkholderia sabiae TaxID=273251 RepID=A0ABU9Q880_9BURK|nr:thioredoxin family protein [Paraburkholderia sabiae]WJZ77759.1 thioredoxin family protein [Paraburkholderia sabiae]CAD6532577.1 Thiol-disulfide oxidoreductase ResA [Paraburkholderia sabiae]CAG9234522.1 Redoxin domain protein [Paraburkholderia sabiae]